MCSRLSDAIKKGKRKEIETALEKFEEIIPPEFRIADDKELVDRAREKFEYLKYNRREPNYFLYFSYVRIE